MRETVRRFIFALVTSLLALLIIAPLSSQAVDGYIAVAKRLKERFPNLPILLGGAGGYLPDTRTPEIWAEMAIAISTIRSDFGRSPVVSTSSTTNRF